MGLKLGIVGLGSFAQSFIPLFKAHPLVDRLALCDLDRAKLEENARKHGVEKTYPSLDAVCADDAINAVAIITQHWLHAPQAIQALAAGKDVYSAVPAAYSVEDMKRLVRAVEESRGRVYMMGETSYYYPETIYCRGRFRKGDFGHVVYSEGEYYHDWDHGLYDVWAWRRGPGWRAFAGDPPMYYPTHSTSFAVSVTGARATHVSCQGFKDTREADRDIYRPDNPWRNVFSNETALFRMSDGSSCRVNEFRRVGHAGAVRMTMFGTEASFECNTRGAAWVTKHGSEPLDALFTPDKRTGLSPVHDVKRLPEALLAEHGSYSHGGSHSFLVDDFLRSCADRSLPPVNVWEAARYVIPGHVAHESAIRGGELVEVPDLGGPR